MRGLLGGTSTEKMYKNQIRYIFVCSWATPGLLQALHSGITPGDGQGTIWDAQDPLSDSVTEIFR